MKKEYIIPAVTVTSLCNAVILAGSVLVNGGKENDGVADAKFNESFFDDEDDE